MALLVLYIAGAGQLQELGTRHITTLHPNSPRISPHPPNPISSDLPLRKLPHNNKMQLLILEILLHPKQRNDHPPPIQPRQLRRRIRLRVQHEMHTIMEIAPTVRVRTFFQKRVGLARYAVRCACI